MCFATMRAEHGGGGQEAVKAQLVLTKGKT